MVIYQIDAFTTEAFKGNPAGVCITDSPLPDSYMQQLANEMNLSETAFIVPTGKLNDWQIRYFTPTTEVPLCGHATLAAAHLMYENKLIATTETIFFYAKGGILQVIKKREKIVMNFPAYPIKRAAAPTSLEEMLGFPPVDFYESINDWKIAVLENEDQILQTRVNSAFLVQNKLGHLIVTAPANSPDTEYVVRVFAPASGIDEDPVTGSAQCMLIPLWHERTGKNTFTSIQLSQRTGTLFTKFLNERVEIAGEAKTVFKIDVLV